MFIEDFEVVARVFLGREGIHLSADGIDGLRDVLSGSSRGPLEQHVLDEMSDAALLHRLVTRATSEPDADADRAHVRHPLGEESKTIREHVADDCWL